MRAVFAVLIIFAWSVVSPIPCGELVFGLALFFWKICDELEKIRRKP